MATSKNTLGLVVCAFFIVSLGLVIYVEKAIGISICHSEQVSCQKADCTNTPDLTGGVDLIYGLPIGQAREGMRLSCQVSVKQNMKIEVPAEVFSVQKWDCEVVSNRNVATFIKELVLKLPEGENLNFQSGGFIQIDVPPFETNFSEFDIEEEFHEDWDRFRVWDLKTVNRETIFRAYSMANHPAEGNIVMLNIRIATPPPDREKGGWMDVMPGLASSLTRSMAMST